MEIDMDSKLLAKLRNYARALPMLRALEFKVVSNGIEASGEVIFEDSAAQWW